MKYFHLIFALICSTFLGLLSTSCSSDDNVPEGTFVSPSAGNYDPSQSGQAKTDKQKLQKLRNSIRITQQILPRNSRSRTRYRMTPQYITIHSTQNWKAGADALRHSLALRRGALGKIGWHYTTDEDIAVQHIPDNEQGNHAENYRGPGNRYSIGIEMCEHPGNSRSATIDKTAKLAAYLMHTYNIPLSRVVPHYNWPRRGYKVANKNCPHFLLNNGRPGRKWRNFLKKVNNYYKKALLSNNTPPRPSPTVGTRPAMVSNYYRAEEIPEAIYAPSLHPTTLINPNTSYTYPALSTTESNYPGYTPLSNSNPSFQRTY